MQSMGTIPGTVRIHVFLVAFYTLHRIVYIYITRIQSIHASDALLWIVIGLVKMQEHAASNLMLTNNYDNTKKGSTNLFSGLFSKLG